MLRERRDAKERDCRYNSPGACHYAEHSTAALSETPAPEFREIFESALPDIF